MFEHYWTIVGESSIGVALREAAPFVPSDRPITIVADGDWTSEGSWVVGPAVLTSTPNLQTRYAPYLAAYEAVEELKRGVDSGQVGKVYGLFGSLRVARDTHPSEVQLDALLPVLGIALDVISDPIVRVWATNASLIAEHDAWFVQLRTQSEILITLEAIACCEPTLGSELLIEVTGQDHVLRAEPMRQSVVVETLGAAPAAYPWWEDLNERFLSLIMERDRLRDDGAASRMRAIWEATMQSAASGEPVTFG